MKITHILLYGFMAVSTLLPCRLQAQYTNTTNQNHEIKGTPQNQRRGTLPGQKRWFTGGMIGGGFSTYNAYVQVAPIVGYKVTPRLDVGTRLTYIYESYKDYTGFRHNLHSYGASVFTRYRMFSFLFAHVEYEILSVPIYPYEGDRRSVNGLFLGGGFMQRMGGAGFATVSILYNVLDATYSPYSNPLIRIGFGIGF